MYMANGHGYAAPVTTVTTWGVNDGGGAPYTSSSFATAVGDSATMSALQQEKRRTRVTAGVLWAGTGALTLVGIVSAANILDEPEWTDCSYLDEDYESCLDSVDAERDALYAHNTNAGVWTAVGFTGALTTATIALVLPPITRVRQQYVHRYYTPADADRWIESHNKKIRDELGLSDSDVQGIDLQSRVEPVWTIGVGPASVAVAVAF
jgi:hypothetical protein